MQQQIQKKAFISVKHKDTEVKIDSNNTPGDIAFFALIALVIMFGMWMKWGRHQGGKYYPKHTNKDNR